MGKRIKKNGGTKKMSMQKVYILFYYIDREYYNRDKKKYEDELLRWVFFIYRKWVEIMGFKKIRDKFF